MVENIDAMEQAVLFQCARDMRKALSYRSVSDLVEAISGQDNPNIKRKMQDILERRAVNQVDTHDIARSIMIFVSDNYIRMMKFYEGRNVSVARFLSEILTRHNLLDLSKHGNAPSIFPESTQGEFLRHVFNNFGKPIRKGNGVLQTGIYQMFRRYKPPVTALKNLHGQNYDWGNPQNHVLICELIYVDSERMESIIITCERQLYFGSLFINAEDVMFGTFQRVTKNNGVNVRLISLAMEGRALPLYSGVAIKVGDTTHRPLATELMFVRVPPGTHGDLYAEIKSIFDGGWNNKFVPPIARRNIIARYLSDPPPLGPFDPADERWRRVKFIRDFPGLRNLVTPNSDNIVYFREPIRTNSAEEIVAICSTMQAPRVYIQDEEEEDGGR